MKRTGKKAAKTKEKALDEKWHSRAMQAKARRMLPLKGLGEEYKRSSIEKLVQKKLLDAGIKKVKAKVFLSVEELLADEKAYKFVWQESKPTIPGHRALGVVRREENAAKLYKKLIFDRPGHIHSFWSYDAKELYLFLGPRADLSKLSDIIEKEVGLAKKIYARKNAGKK